MRYTLKTRLLAMFLAVMMVIGMPLTVFAEEAGSEATGTVAPAESTPVLAEMSEGSDEEPEDDTHVHADGTATCKVLAVCECGESYGELAEHTASEDGTVCTVCGTELVVHTHSGGTATCKALAVCECGESYGELAEHTASEDGTVCTVCGTELVAHTHSGGTATCKEKAVCECGESYGELADHIPAEDDGDCTTEIICIVCGEVTMEAAEMHTAGEEETICAVCGAEIPRILSDVYTNVTREPTAEDLKSPKIVYTPHDDYYKVISKTDYNLGPGITESEIVLNNAGGSHQQVAHVVEVDIDNPFVKVMPSYKGMNELWPEEKYGVQIMSEQAAYAEANGYGNILAAMNISLSWYDSAYYKEHPELVGEPLGYLVMDGKLYVNSGGQTSGAQTCVVINYDEKNGEARPADMPKVQIRYTSSAITGWEYQVIPANFGFLVKDGKNQYSKNNNASSGASRSFVGIKEDGTFVMVMNDGRQSPYSAGFTEYEMAEFMLSLGCVQAVNGDGGGSSAFLSQRPGEEFKLNCSPSDGAERPTTHGILVISNAPADGQFARATITAEHEYYTPGSTVTFTALGTDLVGTKAEIPADVTWQLADSSMGTIEDGVFVSSGKVGTAITQMVYNGAVVGEGSVEIVIPETIQFMQSVMTIPYDKEVDMGLVATVNGGLNTVVLKPSDVTFVFSNDALGSLNGFKFTSVSEENSPENISSTVTATLNFGEGLVSTTTMSLGKGSEVLFDFENGIDEWKTGVVNGYHESGFKAEISHASAENGEVYNGNGSLRLETNGLSAADVSAGGYAQVPVYLEDGVIIENAKRLGFWAYIPDEYEHCWIRVLYWYSSKNDGVYDKKNTITVINQPEVYNTWDESGWKYFSVDISAYKSILIPGINDPDTTFPAANHPNKGTAKEPNDYRFIEFMFPHTNTNALWQTFGSINGPYTIYIDNITADYSDAVDDREAPIFNSVVTTVNDSPITMEKYAPVTVSSNVLSVQANVVEDTAKTNATGLNSASAKAYVDGVEVGATYANGRINMQEVAVANGMHRVKFEISDNAGNKSVVIRLINVQSSVDASTVQLVPKDATLDRLYGGSVYWMDLKASDIETIQSVSTVIDLNSVNHWELDYMVLADGFTATYAVDAETNTATITITRSGENLQTGEAVLASLPIRIISFDTDMHIKGYTAETFWKNYDFWPQDLKVDVDMGKITYVDGYTSNVLNTFSNKEFSVTTETYTVKSLMDKAFFAARGTAHVHTAEAADLDATCSTDGYTGRTYCAVCESVVAWGTNVSATGIHSYDFVDGKLVCTSGGELFNGIHTDGKTYVDGVAAADGWNGESYYVDGVMITGIYQIDGKYYNFGENGICPNGYPMSAEWWTNEKGESYYFNVGVPMTEYCMIEGVATYFDENGVAYQGEIEINGQICVFEKGVFVKSTTANVLAAGRIGTDAHFIFYADGTLKLVGEGDTYDCVSVGENHLPKLSWKNRPWGKNSDLSNGIKKVVVGKDLTSVGAFMFYQCYNIAAVEFEADSKLVEIDEKAFHYANKVKSVILPDSVTTMGFSAFGYCASLVDVVMPEAAVNINSNAFWHNNSKLVLNVAEGSPSEAFAQKVGLNYVTRKPVYGPADVRPSDVVVDSGTCGSDVTWTLYEGGKLILGGSGAMDNYSSHKDTPWFNYKDQVKAVKIGKNVTTIGKNAFAHMYNLAYIVFEEGSVATSLGDHAFHYASKVKDVVLPDGIKTIGYSALGYCASLTKVQMPEHATTINSNAFWNDSAKLVLNVVAGSAAETFAQKQGINYETRESAYGPGDVVPGDVVITSGTCGANATWTLYEGGKLVVTGSGAIDNYDSHKNTPWAEYRTQIKSVKIGKDITAVGNNAFAHMYALVEIVFEDGSCLTTLGNHAFHYASKVKEVVLPDGIKSMGYSALGYCASLVKVQMPEFVTTISSNAFWNHNSNLVLNVVEGSAAETYAQKQGIAYETRASKYGPADPIPGETVVASGSCGTNATWYFYASGKLVIEGSGHMDNYTSQNKTPWAEYRTQVKSVKIGRDIVTVGDNAFAHMYNLATIVFEEGSKATTLGSHAFHYASQVKEIILPDSVETIGYSAMGYGAKLKHVQMSANAGNISPWAFWNARADLTLSVVENSKAHAFAVANSINVTLR